MEIKRLNSTHLYPIKGDNLMPILNLLKKEKGFTAVELIIVIAVVSIIFLGLNSAIMSGYNNFRILNDRAEIQRSIRLIENIINNNIRYAESIKIKNSTRPAGNSNYDQVLELSEKKDDLHRILYNGRPITDNIVKNMSPMLNNSRLDLEIEFSNNQVIRFYTILANIDSK
jgi:prepilin-type N-terminal cleavage/methylation domain-containing protein